MSWPQFWTQKSSWQSVLLKPLSACVCFIAKRRLAKFKRNPPGFMSPTKIIVVGNIVVGGAGKTPFILWLAEQLTQQNIRFGIVSRGYGGKNEQGAIWVMPHSCPKLVGDEPVLLARKLQCPVAVSAKRVEAIAMLAERCQGDEALDVIISDDGLQHYAMNRDVEVVIFDGQRGMGNQQCLPGGPLRESAQRLVSANIVVSNGLCEDININRLAATSIETMVLEPVCFRRVNEPNITCPLDSFASQSVHAIAGIGNPKRFYDTLKELNIACESMAFDDHQAYQQSDFNWKQEGKPLLMTEKDAVKCIDFAEEDWWYLEVKPACSIALATKILGALKLPRKINLQPISLT